MRWMSLNEVREKYLSFFESKNHLRLPSYSLVPHNDNSLLLINSGMAPMKKFFTGEEEPPRRRVTTCQKCIRTPDIDRVGITARHGTFFEMLGNFSFGDYFKVEAIQWAWEFLTEWMEIPAELLYPSIFENDEEAFEIWTKIVGVPAERVIRMGREDNFWEHGSGPCGPCSEIYFDRGIKYGCGKPDCKPGCDCDRFMEIWNNVFSQFNNDGNGNYTDLVQKNIDTGMGLERLACVLQGVDNLFEVDTVRKILDTVCEYAGKKYGDNDKNDISIRVVTDHIRGASFMISDGILPSNEGRGYVLRRILRRAARHGRLLGIDRAFLADLCDVMIDQNAGAYPELEERREYIKKVISMEEERFNAKIDSGLSILNKLIAETKAQNGTALPAAGVFELHDAFGFPIDITREIAADAGLDVDEEGFTALMNEQRNRARAARANIGGWSESSKTYLAELPKTEFCGYTATKADAKVLCIIAGDDKLDMVNDGEFTVVLDTTPFYGEGGGQVGDTGKLYNNGFEAEVLDTKKTDGVYLHLCRAISGTLTVGDALTAEIDADRRAAIARNHTTCHLLQAALRRVLGTHVEQAGSYVDADRVRFDFTHFAAVTPEELKAIEELVNGEILRGEAVITTETDIETAKKSGAMALFGEKYGSTVRMVKAGDFSTELCGGTHLDNTAKAGLFKVVSESSVAAGVRRIEGTTGLGILAELKAKDDILASAAKELKATSVNDLVRRINALQAEVKEVKRELDSANEKLSAAKLDGILGSKKQIGSVYLIAAELDMKPNAARALCDKIKAEHPDCVALFAAVSEGKLNFAAACGPDAVKAGAHAGNLCKQVSVICGGNGGGRPDSAMSGGKDLSKIKEALAEAENILAGMLK
ncbi:MAG: alanine--tRNA ligase [Ruminococcaceae bacterium]|nr:alanine--tRNA ligase [Oscillospiraceae bacterium]